MSLGQAPAYVGNPAPPITTESVFGHTPPPPSPSPDYGMDIDNIPLILDEFSPPPPATDHDNFLPPHSHPIPEDDFQPDVDVDPSQPPPAPYNEYLEDLEVEEELHAFANIRYGVLSIQDLTGSHVFTTSNRGKHP